MERKNTYGELINNKFSELMSADKDVTWKGMKEILDREMPDKKRKWLLWFRANILIIIIALLSLFAAATAAYKGLNRDKANDSPEVKNIPALKIESKADIENERAAAFPHMETEREEPVIEEERLQIAETHTVKQNIKSIQASTKKIITPKREDAVINKTAVLTTEVKDSVNVLTIPAATEVVERRKAF